MYAEPCDRLVDCSVKYVSGLITRNEEQPVGGVKRKGDHESARSSAPERVVRAVREVLIKAGALPESARHTSPNPTEYRVAIQVISEAPTSSVLAVTCHLNTIQTRARHVT